MLDLKKNKKIKICILEMSSQNKAMLEFFFENSGKSLFEQTNLASASAFILDYDYPGAKENLEEVLETTKIPGILLSIKEIDLPQTVWLEKPVTIKALTEARKKLAEVDFDTASTQVKHIDNNNSSVTEKEPEENPDIIEHHIVDSAENNVTTHTATENTKKESEEPLELDSSLAIDATNHSANTDDTNELVEPEESEINIAIESDTKAFQDISLDEVPKEAELEQTKPDIEEVVAKETTIEDDDELIHHNILANLTENALPETATVSSSLTNERKIPAFSGSSELPVFPDIENDKQATDNSEKQVINSEFNDSSNKPEDSKSEIDLLLESLISGGQSDTQDTQEKETNDNTEILDFTLDSNENSNEEIQEQDVITQEDDQKTNDAIELTDLLTNMEATSEEQTEQSSPLDDTLVDLKDINLSIDNDIEHKEEKNTEPVLNTNNDLNQDSVESNKEQFPEFSTLNENNNSESDAEKNQESELLLSDEDNINANNDALLEELLISDTKQTESTIDETLDLAPNVSEQSTKATHSEEEISSVKNLVEETESSSAELVDDMSAEEELQSLLEEIRQEAEGQGTASVASSSSENHYIPTVAEERWALTCGTTDTTVATTKKDKNNLSYNMKDYMLSTLLAVLEQAEQTKKVMRLKFNGIIIVIDTMFDTIYSDLSIYSDEYAEVCFNPIDQEAIKVHNLDKSEIRLYHKLYIEEPEYAHNIESFIWTSSLLTSRGRLPEGTNLKKIVGIKYWPNLTRVENIPHMMQIAAVLYKSPTSLLDIPTLLNIEKCYVYAFYNAVVSLQMIEHDEKKMKKSISSKKSFKKTENRNFFSRLLKKIKT